MIGKSNPTEVGRQGPVTVAALYVDPRGPYPKLAGVDPWDAKRDARNYAGPWPVVAHPPCGPWGMLRHLYQGAEHELGLYAVGQVRIWGGILEHPAHSALWPASGLPRPLPGEADEFGGYSVEVCQCDWGHPARKRSWLYMVGVDRARIVFPPRREPTHWCSGSRNAPRGPVPAGIKVCSSRQRRRTPEAFARWLVALAATAERGAA